MSTILLIEDDALLAKALRLLLESEGYTVHVAAAGYEGISLARQVKPNLVILDVGLPDGDGHVVARSLRWDIVLTKTQILFLSGRQTDADLELARDVGAVGFILKPYNAEDLLEIIRKTVTHG